MITITSTVFYDNDNGNSKGNGIDNDNDNGNGNDNDNGNGNSKGNGIDNDNDNGNDDEKDNCWFSHDVTKIQTTKLSILLRFYFHGVLGQLKTNFQTNFRFKRVLGFERVRLNF